MHDPNKHIFLIFSNLSSYRSPNLMGSLIKEYLHGCHVLSKIHLANRLITLFIIHYHTQVDILTELSTIVLTHSHTMTPFDATGKQAF